MSGQPSRDLAPVYADLIQSLNKSTGIEETVLVGHSAGATAAIRIGSMIPNSRAVAVNGQFSAEFYHSNVMSDLKEYAFKYDHSNESFLDVYRDRLDLRSCLQNRAKNSTFSWFSHVDDIENSHGDHPSYPEICRFFGVPQSGGNTIYGDSIALCNWESKGINPHALPGTVIPFLNEVLGEPTKFDIGVLGILELKWHELESVKPIYKALGASKIRYRCEDPTINYDPLYEATIFGTTASNGSLGRNFGLVRNHESSCRAIQTAYLLTCFIFRKTPRDC